MSQIILEEDSPAYRVAKEIEDQPKKQFKGVYIPAAIWLCKTLSWQEKCLWAEVDSLSSEHKACTASNEYLAKMMDSTPSNIAKTLSYFRQIGLIQDMGFNGRIRKIRATTLTDKLKQCLLNGNLALYRGVKKDTSKKSTSTEEPPNPLDKGEGDSRCSSPIPILPEPKKKTEQTNTGHPKSDTADEPEKKKSSAKKRKEVIPDAEFIQKLSETYPNLNVPTELQNARGWILANPPRIFNRQFVSNWMSRANTRNAELKINANSHAEKSPTDRMYFST